VSGARVLSLALVAAGVAAGSIFDTVRVAPPPRAGGYYVLSADFHVHAFPGDGALPLWELAREASRRGLHAVVVSNHNQTLAAKFFPVDFSRFLEPGKINREEFSPLVIPSQEITTPRFHLVAAGITQTIDWTGSELDIVDAVQRQGGVVIAAHPVGRYWKADDALLAALDGAEVAHPLTSMLKSGRDELTAFFTRAHAVNSTLAPIGSSDFHLIAPIGVCRTYVLAESVSVQGVLDAIRAGRTIARDQDGVLYGSPEHTLLIDSIAAGPDVPPVRRRSTLAALMVLVGLVGLVIWK